MYRKKDESVYVHILKHKNILIFGSNEIFLVKNILRKI